MRALWQILAGFLLIQLAGCATAIEQQNSAEVVIRKGVPVVYVYPLSREPYTNGSIAIPTFRVPAHMEGQFGNRVAGLFREVFLGKQTFPRVKQISASYGTISEALAAGREAGTDLVLAGEILYALEGTELGGTRLEMAVRLLNVNSGQTIWYIGQNMDQPVAYPEMGFLRRTLDSLQPPAVKRSNGGQVLANMMAQVAVDMADVMGGAQRVKR